MLKRVLLVGVGHIVWTTMEEKRAQKANQGCDQEAEYKCDTPDEVSSVCIHSNSCQVYEDTRADVEEKFVNEAETEVQGPRSVF